MSSGTSDKSFNQQWLQSLTLAAREPVAQRVKPLLETINELTRQHSESDRAVSARTLWDFASSEGLLPALSWMPIQQTNWIFDRDDNFGYSRRHNSTIPSVAKDFETWSGWLGIQACEVPLTAEVNSRDWTTLLRQEAVRLRQTLDTAAVPAGLTLHLDCTASWDTKSWSIRFDDAQWLVVRYEDPFSVERPEVAQMEEALWLMIVQAAEALVPKHAPKIQFDSEPAPWMSCVPRLQSVHKQLLITDAQDYPAWFRRVWSCVWTIVYREQNVLKGQANIDFIRQEAATAIKETPRLTLWMFCLAKLVCECQLGRGLGISADYLA